MSAGLRPDGFHMVIGGLPLGRDNAPSLATDLAMVKASLLYADSATLISPTSYMLLVLARSNDLSDDEKVELVLRLFTSTGNGLLASPEQMRVIEEIRSFRTQQLVGPMSQSDSARQRQLRNLVINEIIPVMTQTVTEVTAGTGAREILRAIEAGRLTLYDFGSIDDTGHLVDEFFRVVVYAFTEGLSYPLFDRPTADLLNAGIRDGVVTLSDGLTSRGKQVGLAADFLQRLPMFEDARIEEVLEIRDSLNDPLVRFRTAMLSFAEKIRSEAWDSNFADDAENLFVAEVAPAVLEIEEFANQNSLSRSLLRRASTPAASASGAGVLSAIMTSASALPGSLGPVISALGTVGTIAQGVRTVEDWLGARDQIQSNGLYFYYQAKQRLRKNSKRRSKRKRS